MKIFNGIFLLLFAACGARAQDPASQNLKKGTWELGVFAGGGTGLGHSFNTQFLYAGGRVGRVMIGEHLHGWMRGNFEFAGDFMPVYMVLAPNENIYGGSFKPVILQWNFTSGKRIVPYLAAAGGVLVSIRDVPPGLFVKSHSPPGPTSNVNFTPQGVFGVHMFVKPKRALLLETAIVHHSSAGLGRLNPGYNAAFFFSIGYTWFK
jgi:lipid A 3-O-deacylase